MTRTKPGRQRRVLVSYVGTSDPTSRGSEGPILSIVRFLIDRGDSPDRVVLIATSSHTHEYRLSDGSTITFPQQGLEGPAAEVGKALKVLLPTAGVTTLLVPVNPANVDEVLTATLDALTPILAPADEVHYNVSSGTQAMGAVIAFLAESRIVPRYKVWQVLDPTRIPAAAERVKEVNFGFLSENGRVRRACQLLAIGSFRDAMLAFEELSEASYISSRRSRAKTIARLAQGYAAWDAGDFATAQKLLRAARAELSAAQLDSIAEQVDLQLTILRPLQTDLERSPAFLQFLQARAYRRHTQGLYSAVAVLARRLYQAALDYLGHRWRIDPPCVQTATLYDKYTKISTALKKLGKSAELRRLQAIGRIYTKEIEKIRNYCLDEHGVSSVTEAQAYRLLSSVDQILQQCVSGMVLQSHGHLMPDELAHLSTMIRERI